MGYAAPAPVVKYTSVAPAASHVASASAVYAAPAPIIEYAAPAPAVSYTAPALAVYAEPTSSGELRQYRQPAVSHAVPASVTAVPVTYAAATTMTVTGIHLIGDCISDASHQRQLDYGALVVYSAPMQYEVLVCYHAVTTTVTGVDLNRDGMPGVLQQPQVSSAAPVQ